MEEKVQRGCDMKPELLLQFISDVLVNEHKLKRNNKFLEQLKSAFDVSWENYFIKLDEIKRKEESKMNQVDSKSIEMELKQFEIEDKHSGKVNKVYQKQRKEQEKLAEKARKEQEKLAEKARKEEEKAKKEQEKLAEKARKEEEKLQEKARKEEEKLQEKARKEQEKKEKTVGRTKKVNLEKDEDSVDEDELRKSLKSTKKNIVSNHFEETDDKDDEDEEDEEEEEEEEEDEEEPQNLSLRLGKLCYYSIDFITNVNLVSRDNKVYQIEEGSTSKKLLCNEDGEPVSVGIIVDKKEGKKGIVFMSKFKGLTSTINYNY